MLPRGILLTRGVTYFAKMTQQTVLPDPLPFVSRNENEPLTLPKVIEFFKLASNPEKTIFVPPVRPKGGEVYLFIPDYSDSTSKVYKLAIC